MEPDKKKGSRTLKKSEKISVERAVENEIAEIIEQYIIEYDPDLSKRNLSLIEKELEYRKNEKDREFDLIEKEIEYKYQLLKKEQDIEHKYAGIRTWMPYILIIMFFAGSILSLLLGNTPVAIALGPSAMAGLIAALVLAKNYKKDELKEKYKEELKENLESNALPGTEETTTAVQKEG